MNADGGARGGVGAVLAVALLAACGGDPDDAPDGAIGGDDGGGLTDASVDDGGDASSTDDAGVSTDGGACSGADCSELDSTCTMGVCEDGSGACVAIPLPDGTTCTATAAACTAARGTCDGAGVCNAVAGCSGSCAMATIVRDGDVFPSESTAGATESLDDRCLPGAPGAVLFYAVAVPAGQRLVARVTPAAGWDPVVRLLHSCTALTCLEGTDRGAAGAPEALVWDNREATSRNVFFAVGGKDATPGAFRLEVDVQTTPSPTHTACDSALAVSDGTHLRNEDNSTSTGIVTGTGCSGSHSNALFYRVTVPAGEVLLVEAVPLWSWRPVVELLDLCSGSTCMAGSTPSIEHDSAFAGYHNDSPLPVELLIAVGAGSGLYDLHIVTDPPAAHTTCAAAVAVSDGTSREGEHVFGATESLAAEACGEAVEGAVFYRASVPAGHTFRASTWPRGTWTRSMRLLSGCTGGSCLAGTSFSSGDQRLSLEWQNDSAVTEDVWLAVGRSGSRRGVFDLEVEIDPPPDNSTCGAATPVTSGDLLVDQRVAFGSESLETLCAASHTGPVLYYSMDLAPADIVQVSVSTDAGWAPLVRELDACGAASCVSALASVPYQMVNDGAATDNVVLAIGGDSRVDRFDAAFTRVPLVRTMGAAACSDLIRGAVDLSFDSYDWSPTVALPFAFDFLGTTVTHFYVANTGLAVLEPAETAPPSRRAGRSPLPGTNEHGAAIAPFWSSLQSPSSGTATVRYAVEGTAPNRRLVIGWTNFASSYDTQASMTFQLHLHETSHAIEIHYCSMTTTSGSVGAIDGSVASIGLQDATGLLGYRHGYQEPGSVTSGTALFLTPSP